MMGAGRACGDCHPGTTIQCGGGRGLAHYPPPMVSAGSGGECVYYPALVSGKSTMMALYATDLQALRLAWG